MGSSALAYGVGGFVLALFSNGARKLPLMRRPWEHVLYFGVGTWVGTKVQEFKENNRQLLTEALDQREADAAAREERLAARKLKQQAS